MLAEIERHGCVTAIGQGIVASAATLPLICASEIVLHRDVAVMIHDPAGMTIGPAPAHRATADMLEKLGGIYAQAYARNIGHPVARVSAWMAEETWLTAEEALALNFCDRIEDPDGAAPVPPAVAGFDVTAFHNPPAALVQLVNGRAAVPPASSEKESKRASR